MAVTALTYGRLTVLTVFVLAMLAGLLIGGFFKFITAAMLVVPGIALARASLGFFDTNKWFVSSQGHRIHQHLVESGGGFDATALGERLVRSPAAATTRRCRRIPADRATSG